MIEGDLYVAGRKAYNSVTVILNAEPAGDVVVVEGPFRGGSGPWQVQ